MKREARPLQTMRGRLVRIMLLISGLTGVATFATVAWISVRTSSRHVTSIQRSIEEGIVSKGKVLTENHALALRGLSLDNAFVDMRLLVERAVRGDHDLVYDLFVNADNECLALSRQAAAADTAAPLARDAWRQLGLAPEELNADQDRVQRATRLGQDVLEVAVPVRNDDGERLGTIRYGLSTRPMHQALARAQAEGQQSLLWSVLSIAGMVGLTTVIGLLLSRVQAVRITRPVGELTSAARSLASGNRMVRVDIDSGDELEVLGSSFNHMVEELATSYRRLEEMNRTLEQKVEQRTAELALKNRDMQLILDNVDQGFATLSPSGALAGGCSRVFVEWFGDHVGAGHADFGAFMRGTSRPFGEAFECAWSQVSDGFLPLELAIDQLPQELAVGGRTWSFRYQPFFEAEQLAGVLVMAVEITERLVREREEAEHAELMQSFSRLMLDKVGFVAFLREAGRMVRSICDRTLDGDPVLLYRTLHTLKGNAAVLGLRLLAAACHDLEDELAAARATSSERLQQLSARWKRIDEHIHKYVASSDERIIEIDLTEYSTLIDRLSQDESQPDLLARVRAWGLEPATRPLERLAEQGRALAARLGKEGLSIEVSAGDIRLDTDTWAPFFSELVHLVRNAVDHGIEPPEERAARGKPSGGKLFLGVLASAQGTSFEVRDDGRGVDWERIRQCAQERGLRHATQADLLEALCQDGITTRTTASETSGRGVGMAAFEACVRRMKGTLSVQSAPGKGTSWLIRFPPGPHAAAPPSTATRAVAKSSRPSVRLELT